MPFCTGLDRTKVKIGIECETLTFGTRSLEIYFAVVLLEFTEAYLLLAKVGAVAQKKCSASQTCTCHSDWLSTTLPVLAESRTAFENVLRRSVCVGLTKESVDAIENKFTVMLNFWVAQVLAGMVGNARKAREPIETSVAKMKKDKFGKLLKADTSVEANVQKIMAAVNDNKSKNLKKARKEFDTSLQSGSNDKRDDGRNDPEIRGTALFLQICVQELVRSAYG